MRKRENECVDVFVCVTTPKKGKLKYTHWTQWTKRTFKSMYSWCVFSHFVLNMMQTTLLHIGVKFLSWHTIHSLCDLKLNYASSHSRKPQCFFSENTPIIIIAFHTSFNNDNNDKMMTIIIISIKFNDTNQMKMILKWKTKRQKPPAWARWRIKGASFHFI